MNFKKSSFSRMNDPVSRLKRIRQYVRRQVRGGNNFFENFENEIVNVCKCKCNWILSYGKAITIESCN